jgi:hypothetical protein
MVGNGRLTSRDHGVGPSSHRDRGVFSPHTVVRISLYIKIREINVKSRFNLKNMRGL